MKVSGGTIVDAAIITTPSSTKNSSGERDPEMRQTKKGNQWHFGMKGHIGVDSKTKLIHSAVVTPANVHDSQPLPNLAARCRNPRLGRLCLYWTKASDQEGRAESA